MEQEHEELHRELRELAEMPSEVRRTAKLVAQVLDAHFERENESALPVIGMTKRSNRQVAIKFVRKSKLFWYVGPEP